MPTICIRTGLFAAVLFSALFSSGCGKNDPKQLMHKAEKDVEEFLDAWSRGEPPDKFAGSDHPIQGTDPDWKEGRRLLSFLCSGTKLSEEMPDHVRCRVALFLQDKKGEKLDKQVVYDVHLGPKSVISRASP
ncbi:MAG TPA: hypothetical protein VMF69_09555 [Gemmataceae bacterium]|nr:hypothetical protein [Gemmataceae bacterium]